MEIIQVSSAMLFYSSINMRTAVYAECRCSPHKILYFAVNTHMSDTLPVSIIVFVTTGSRGVGSQVGQDKQNYCSDVKTKTQPWPYIISDVNSWTVIQRRIEFMHRKLSD